MDPSSIELSRIVVKRALIGDLTRLPEDIGRSKEHGKDILGQVVCETGWTEC
jgi:hypothetical protein